MKKSAPRRNGDAVVDIGDGLAFLSGTVASGRDRTVSYIFRSDSKDVGKKMSK